MEKKNMKYYYSLAALLLCIITGCGTGHVSLKGKVTFSDDGSPLTLGTVTLSTGSFQSRGDLDEKGEFIMESLRPGDGLPPGTYTVSIAGAIDYNSGGGQYSLVDPKWAYPDTSEMKVEVDRKTKFLDIQVDRNPQPPR
jgi:hypothetical protein